MTPQRRQAIEDFNISIRMVKTTIVTIMRIESHISDVQTKLNERFNSDDICATASDTTRTELSSLRKELEGQRASARIKSANSLSTSMRLLALVLQTHVYNLWH